MKEDIEFLPVENVQLAVIREKNNDDEVLWSVHILNKNKEKISNVLISSKGYGEKNGEKQSTSILRHFIEQVESGESAIIEPIDPDLFHLFNEYWVSYYIGDQIYDKKFIFVPGSLNTNYISFIDMIQKEGILHS